VRSSGGSPPKSGRHPLRIVDRERTGRWISRRGGFIHKVNPENAVGEYLIFMPKCRVKSENQPGPTSGFRNTRLSPHLPRARRYPMAIIWFSVSHARVNTSPGTCFQAWGFASRTRQSNDLG
jgi:hypothetical protein